MSELVFAKSASADRIGALETALGDLIDRIDDDPNYVPSSEALLRARALLASRTTNPDAACQHEGWSFKANGRCCPKCNAFVVDFGD